MQKPIHTREQESKIMAWIPAILYGANIITWILIDTMAKRWDLLWLSILPISVIVLYAFKHVRYQS